MAIYTVGVLTFACFALHAVPTEWLLDLLFALQLCNRGYGVAHPVVAWILGGNTACGEYAFLAAALLLTRGLGQIDRAPVL